MFNTYFEEFVRFLFIYTFVVSTFQMMFHDYKKGAQIGLINYDLCMQFNDVFLMINKSNYVNVHKMQFY